MESQFPHNVARIGPYRLELLPIVPAFHRRARVADLSTGELVYYGPTPSYYGIGEIQTITEKYVVVDFMGTGTFGVHQDVFEPQYLIQVPSTHRGLI